MNLISGTLGALISGFCCCCNIGFGEESGLTIVKVNAKEHFDVHRLNHGKTSVKTVKEVVCWAKKGVLARQRWKAQLQNLGRNRWSTP